MHDDANVDELGGHHVMDVSQDRVGVRNLVRHASTCFTSARHASMRLESGRRQPWLHQPRPPTPSESPFHPNLYSIATITPPSEQATPLPSADTSVAG